MNSVVKNSFIYLSSSMLSKGMPFLLIPLLASYLSKAEFGMLSLFLVLNVFSMAIIGMSLQVNITKNFYKKNREELSLIIGSSINVLAASVLFYTLVIIILVSIFGEVFSVSSKYLLILPCISLFQTLNQINLTVLRNEGRAYLFGIFEISGALITFALTLICLFLLNIGWYSQAIGILVSSSILGIIGLRYLLKRSYILFRWDKKYIIDVIKTSFPLVPHAVGGVVIAVSDRLFIEDMIGLEAVAIYSVGYSFGVLVSLLIDAIIKAWNPWFYKELLNPSFEKKIMIVKMTYLYILSIFLSALIISFISITLFPILFDEGYYEAKDYIIWISLGYAVQGIYKILHPYLVLTGKTSYLAISSFLAAVLNLILNYYLINFYGVIGAAYATILAFLASTILVLFFQKCFFRMPWLFWKE